MAKLTSLELWRLADTLSVVNAAILICGGDPSEYSYDDNNERFQHTWQHEGFEAAFNALRGAVLTNKLAANVSHALRGEKFVCGFGDEEPYEVFAEANEEQISYDMLIARHCKGGGYGSKIAGQTLLNFSMDSLRSEQYLYICKEPNWEQTTLDIENLQKWLEKRDIFPDFFFPKGNVEGFRNAQNPRYSAKLACAVAAWEAIDRPAKHKSVKQTLQDWIQSNGARFGVGDNSVVSPTAAEEVAKIANWNIKGGANITSPSDDIGDNQMAKPVQNYTHGYPENDADDAEIPF